MTYGYAHAIVETTVSAKARSTFRAEYDPQVMMTRLELRGPIELACFMRTDQLAQLHAQLTEALELAKADPFSVGHGLLDNGPRYENKRLSHILEAV